MKRHDCLKPLSREHHYGLSIGQKARTLADDTPADVQQQHWQALVDYIFDNQLSHFQVEEDFLVKPLLEKLQNNPQNQDYIALAKQLVTEHDQLKQLAQCQTPSLDDIRQLGEMLYQHIRFEERQMFGVAENLLTEAQLTAVYQASSQQSKNQL